MKILAIDTSCDETSVAISEDDRVLANVISSQIELHKKWGGVVPSIAQRAHQENIDLAIQEALHQTKLTLDQIDAFAVTQGPGLAIALEVGVSKAKELSLQHHKPLIAVNHMVGHIYAALAKNKNGNGSIEELTFPTLAVLVSGKHSEFVLMKDYFDFQIIGSTLDDAMGEAYDKVARMLNLGYPGGPIIAELATQGDPQAYDFPIPMKQSGDLNLSFSGLKTAVLYTIKKLTANGEELTKQQTVDLAASFQRVAFASVLHKLKQAVEQYPVRQIILGGGVMANVDFRQAIRKTVKPLGIEVYYPDLKKLCTDNAAMIAVAAYYQSKYNMFVEDPTKLDRNPTLSFTRTQ